MFEPDVIVPELDEDEETEAPALLPPSHDFAYRVKLSRADLDELGREVVDALENFRAATAERRDNLAEWRRDYEMLPLEASAGPWEQSSELRAPFVRLACQNHSTRLNNQILRTDPPFYVLPRDQQALGRVETIQQTLTAKLREAEWTEAARELHSDLPVSGNAAIRVTWEQKYERRPRRQVDWDETTFEALIESGVNADEAYVGAVKKDEKGQARIGLGFEDTLVRDGLRLDFVRWEDLIYCPAGARRPEDLWAIGQRVFLSAADLEAGARTGKYLSEQVERLLQLHGDSGLLREGPDDDSEYSGIDLSNPEDSERRPRRRLYECAELCWLDDLNQDNRDEWYIVTAHCETGTVVRVQFMPYEHGQPFYIPFRFLIRPGQITASGTAETLNLVQCAASALLNQFVDLLDLLCNTAGTLIVDPSSGVKPDKWEFRLGRAHFVEDVNGIKEFPIPNGIPAALSVSITALELLKTYAELISASSNPALGRETTSQKTLGEVRLVVDQAMQIFEDMAVGVALSWRRVWEQCLALLIQYSPAGMVEYRIGTQADMRFQAVPVTELQANVELMPAGLSQLADAQSRMQRAVSGQQLLASNPLTAGNPEVQLEALEQVLQELRWPGVDTLMQKIRQSTEQMLALQIQAESAALMAPPEPAAAPARNGSGKVAR